MDDQPIYPQRPLTMGFYELIERLNPLPPVVNWDEPLAEEDAALLEKMSRKMAESAATD